MKFKNTSFLLAVLFAGMFFFGCKHTPEHLAPDYGKSFNAAFKRQALNPEGPKDLSPANALPGKLASDIYKKRYVKTMTEKKEKGKDNISEELGDLD